MAKINVTVGVYAQANRYEECEVISQEQYDERVAERANEIYKNEDEFFDWLEDTYTVEEVWKMTDEKKKAIKEDTFKKKCNDWALDEIQDEWDYFEIETQVNCPCED